ncbi:MAG: O-antigen ligase family protein [Patescibacteria group bacterium]
MGLLFIVVSALSVIGAEDRILAVYRLGWIFEGVFLFFLVVFSNYNILKLFFFLGLGLSVQAGIAVWQFFSQSDFSSKWFGMALHKAEELGVSVIEVSNPGELPERWLRAYGALPHPNILGAAMAGAGLFCLYFLLSRRLKQGIEKRISIAVLTLCFIAMLASFSRSAWLGFTVGYVIIFTGVLLRKNLLARKAMLETILILGLVFFAFFGLYDDLVVVRIKGEGRLENRSITERISSSKEAWEIIKSSPLTGVGIGNYSLAQLRSQRSEIVNRQSPARSDTRSVSGGSIVNLYAWDFQPVHNAFLLVFAETGLFGLTAFIGFLLAVFYSLFALVPASRSVELEGNDTCLGKGKNAAVFGTAIMASLAVMMVFDHFWMSLHFGVLLSFLIPALVLRLKLED